MSSGPPVLRNTNGATDPLPPLTHLEGTVYMTVPVGLPDGWPRGTHDLDDQNTAPVDRRSGPVPGSQCEYDPEGSRLIKPENDWTRFQSRSVLPGFTEGGRGLRPRPKTIYLSPPVRPNLRRGVGLERVDDGSEPTLLSDRPVVQRGVSRGTLVVLLGGWLEP